MKKGRLRYLTWDDQRKHFDECFRFVVNPPSKGFLLCHVGGSLGFKTVYYVATTVTSKNAKFSLSFNSNDYHNIVSMSGTLSISDRQIDIPLEQYISSLVAGEHRVLSYTSKEEKYSLCFCQVWT